MWGWLESQWLSGLVTTAYVQDFGWYDGQVGFSHARGFMQADVTFFLRSGILLSRPGIHLNRTSQDNPGTKDYNLEAQMTSFVQGLDSCSYSTPLVQCAKLRVATRLGPDISYLYSKHWLGLSFRHVSARFSPGSCLPEHHNTAGRRR